MNLVPCENCGKPVPSEPAVERDTGQLYFFCPFCQHNSFLPIIERESNPELKIIVRKERVKNDVSKRETNYITTSNRIETVSEDRGS